MNEQHLQIAIERYNRATTYVPRRHGQRIAKLAEVLSEHPEARVELHHERHAGLGGVGLNKFRPSLAGFYVATWTTTRPGPDLGRVKNRRWCLSH